MTPTHQIQHHLLQNVFDHPDIVGTASSRLVNLRQGSRSVAEYSVEFRTLAAESKWNDSALLSVFLNGLNDQLKDELASKDEPTDFDSLVSLAIRLDNRLRERHREKLGRSRPVYVPRASPPSTSRPSKSPPSKSAHSVHDQSPEEPMQLGKARLTPAERLRRIQSGECLYCSQQAHFVVTCPVRPKDTARP